jgi:hypothetical protein
MDKVWSWFWKIFGCALVAAFVVSIILGIAMHSGSVTYAILKGTFVVGIGICGVIGILMVPIELYFSDKAARGKNK